MPGVSYVDATGNIRIAVAEPAVFVLVRGANSDHGAVRNDPRTLCVGDAFGNARDMIVCMRKALRGVRCERDQAHEHQPRHGPGGAGSARAGTRRTTDTVHEALRDVVARARRARLAERDFEDLTPEALEAMRRPAGRAA